MWQLSAALRREAEEQHDTLALYSSACVATVASALDSIPFSEFRSVCVAAFTIVRFTLRL